MISEITQITYSDYFPQQNQKKGDALNLFSVRLHLKQERGVLSQASPRLISYILSDGVFGLIIP